MRVEALAENDVVPLPLEPEENAGPLNEEALKGRIDKLRGQARSLGAVNPEVLQDYEELQARHEFLTSQMRDLRQTEGTLRQAIGELDAVTQERFQAAFQVVDREFRNYFASLFGGGSAKLMLSRSDEANAIEIYAQPPGKRVNNLSLLSGGERALTAMALLFALLETNPVPFCVLDEADAALDEANIIRFSQALCQLSRRTQFIVITHNRGTVEAADIIYGISMGEDNVSRVLSMRLNGRRGN